jgi:hypothetical protein
MRLHLLGFAGFLAVVTCLLASPSQAAEQQAVAPPSTVAFGERSGLDSAAQQTIALSAAKIMELGAYSELKDALRAKVKGIDHIVLATCRAVPGQVGSFDVAESHDRQQVIVVTKNGIELWAQWRVLSGPTGGSAGQAKPVYLSKHQVLRQIKSAAELERILGEAGSDTSVDAIEDSFQHGVMGLLQ